MNTAFQPLIDQLVADIRNKNLWYERAREERDAQRADACTHQMLGLKVALGRALSIAKGEPLPSGDLAAQHAIVLANAYLATL